MQKKIPSQEPLNEIAIHPPKLPKWVVPSFIVVMTLSISSFFLNAYFVSEPFGHRMISVIEGPDEFHNVTWDDLLCIPRLNTVSYGNFFTDPWNSYNPGHRGWGNSSFLTFFGGVLIYLFGNYFIAMSIWGLINFSLIIILIYNIFKASPFEFSPAASILGTFFLLNLLWIGGQTFSGLDDAIPRAFLIGWHFSLVEQFSGLFTYLPYILFIYTYWRFVTAPDWKKSVFVGATAGLLTYVYFFHYAFAFGMIAAHIVLAFAFKRKRLALYLAGALGVGVIIALPSVINHLMLSVSSASTNYMQRIDYSPGRSPLQDYHWLLRLQIPFCIGIIYIALRKQAEIKWVMVRTWIVLCLAFVMVLHLRILLGFMQAVDHFWRMSLGIPASLWCILAVFDLARSRLGQFKFSRKMVYIAAIILPLLILARTTADVGYSLQSRDVMSQLSTAQRETLEKIDCLGKVLKPGEGFLTADLALNYYTMVNLNGLPFMAMGISTISVNELSKRYLLSAYLTGRDNVQYPQFGNRKVPGYTNEKDLHLYLYINNFFHPWSDFSLEEQIKQIYQSWNPAIIDWKAWSDALSTVKVVYVENEHFEPAMERLQKLFTVKKIVSCMSGKALRVTSQLEPNMS